MNLTILYRLSRALNKCYTQGDFRYMDLYKFEFVEPQKLIKHTIFTRKNDVNDA